MGEVPIVEFPPVNNEEATETLTDEVKAPDGEKATE